jgi:hypothetical protein
VFFWADVAQMPLLFPHVADAQPFDLKLETGMSSEAPQHRLTLAADALRSAGTDVLNT